MTDFGKFTSCHRDNIYSQHMGVWYLRHKQAAKHQKVIELFYTQLIMKFILLINVKMPTDVGILTSINRIEQERSIFFQHFSFYE